jgi:hypothetical protein
MNDDLGKSLSQDKKKAAKIKVRSSQGDKGELNPIKCDPKEREGGWGEGPVDS